MSCCRAILNFRWFWDGFSGRHQRLSRMAWDDRQRLSRSALTHICKYIDMRKGNWYYLNFFFCSKLSNLIIVQLLWKFDLLASDDDPSRLILYFSFDILTTPDRSSAAVTVFASAGCWQYENSYFYVFRTIICVFMVWREGIGRWGHCHAL